MPKIHIISWVFFPGLDFLILNFFTHENTFNKFIIIIVSLFLTSCQQFDKSEKSINYISNQKYSNTGFALIYDDKLKRDNKITKKIDNRSLLIFHKKIQKNSFVKLTNPTNNKTVIAEVISNNVNFSDFYNSVITSRIAEELDLDIQEPYIDLVLISQNSTFVAKKAKTFDIFKLFANPLQIFEILARLELDQGIGYLLRKKEDEDKAIKDLLMLDEDLKFDTNSALASRFPPFPMGSIFSLPKYLPKDGIGVIDVGCIMTKTSGPPIYFPLIFQDRVHITGFEPSYAEILEKQINNQIEKLGEGKLTDLLRGTKVWTN